MTKMQDNTNIVLNNNNALGKTGRFVSENQKSLLFIIVAVVVMIAGYFIYLKVYLAPREVKAADQMHVAQDFWEKKDWDKAINGDAGYPGFTKIINDYGNTKSANLAYFYLGTAYLNKGDFNKAIENLTSYHGDDAMVAAEALGGTGDAYVELKNYDKAETYFKKAADMAKNKFLSPLYLKKLALVYVAEKKYSDADDAFKKIRSDYYTSEEGKNIDEYIARTEAQM